MPSSPHDPEPVPSADVDTERMPLSARHRAGPGPWWRRWPVAVGAVLLAAGAGLALVVAPDASPASPAAAPPGAGGTAELSDEPRAVPPVPVWRTATSSAPPVEPAPVDPPVLAPSPVPAGVPTEPPVAVAPATGGPAGPADPCRDGDRDGEDDEADDDHRGNGGNRGGTGQGHGRGAGRCG